jgi:hypothetical protein
VEPKFDTQLGMSLKSDRSTSGLAAGAVEGSLSEGMLGVSLMKGAEEWGRTMAVCHVFASMDYEEMQREVILESVSRRLAWALRRAGVFSMLKA